MDCPGDRERDDLADQHGLVHDRGNFSKNAGVRNASTLEVTWMPAHAVRLCDVQMTAVMPADVLGYSDMPR